MKKNSTKSKRAKVSSKTRHIKKKSLVMHKSKVQLRKSESKFKSKSKSKSKVTIKKELLKSKKAVKNNSTQKTKEGKSKLPLLAPGKHQANSDRSSKIKPYKSKKNEVYMGAKQLEHFRKVLLDWKKELMAGVDRTMHHMQSEAANFPDPVDRATQEEEFSLELRARDRERKLLRKIDETLNRISDSDYGYCDDCGAEIGVQRLEARPTATQCIECKTISEIREKQVGDGSNGS